MNNEQPHPNSVEQRGKSAATVAYITFVGGIIAIFMNMEDKNEFSAFHIRQAIGIHLLSFLLAPLVSGFNSLWISLPFWVFCFSLWVYGFIGAMQGRYTLVPLVGQFFQKWFKRLTS